MAMFHHLGRLPNPVPDVHVSLLSRGNTVIVTFAILCCFLIAVKAPFVLASAKSTRWNPRLCAAGSAFCRIDATSCGSKQRAT